MAMRRCLQERLTRVLGRFHHDPVCSHQPFESSWLSQPYLGLGAAGANVGFASDSSTARKPYGSKAGRADGEGAHPNVSRSRPPRRVQPGGHGYNERPRMQRSTPRLEDNGYKSAAPDSPSNHSPLLRQEKNINILTCGQICPHGCQNSYKDVTPNADVRNLNAGESKQHVFMSSDFCDHRGMQLVFLGTSSSMPTLTRNTSCIALRLDGRIFLFDCGEGVQKQLNRTPFRHRTIDSIFITHMHGDHKGLLCMIGMTAPATKQPIEIFGPQGLRQWIRTTLKLCHARVPIKYAVHELVLQEESTRRKTVKRNAEDELHDDELPGKDIFCSKEGLWNVHEDDKYIVVAGLLKHSIPCWGYVVEERLRPGRFSVERAMEAGVQPGPMYAKLQHGNAVTLTNGKTVEPTDVLGPPRKGRKVVILGDTCDSRSLLIAAKGADILVHEATVVEQEAELAAARGHSTASMAGRFARNVDANTLVLTHFSGKLEGALYGTSEKGTIAELVWAAKRRFGKQSVMAAHDLAAVTVVQQDDPAEPVHQSSSSAV